jgi:hypothetical protein
LLSFFFFGLAETDESREGFLLYFAERHREKKESFLRLYAILYTESKENQGEEESLCVN